MYDLIMNIDTSILGFIEEYMYSPFLDRIMPFITRLGNAGMIWIIISIIFIISKRYRKAGILALCSLVIGYILGEVLLKNIIARPRPFVGMPDIELLIPKPTGYSFPSGHATSSFAAAAAFAKMIDNKVIVILLVILAFLIAFSRIYLMVHYPSDILGGIVLGIVSANIAYKFCMKKEDK